MPEYNIDELARAAGSNVRNVRAYLAKNMLPKPQRIGRANVYTDAHLNRLKIIQKMLDRGFSLRHIADMMRAIEQGQSVSALIGLESALTNPLSEELPVHLSLEKLLDLFGPVEPVIIEQAIDLGLLKRDGDKFVAPSPRLIDVGVELVNAGIPLSVILVQISQLRSDVERIADRFVQLVGTEIFDKFDSAIPPASELPRLAQFVERVRPMAQTVVDVELKRAIQSSIHTELGHRLARNAAQAKKSSKRSRKSRKK